MIAVWGTLHTVLALVGVLVLVGWLLVRYRRIKREGPTQKTEVERVTQELGCVMLIGLVLLISAAAGVSQQISRVARAVERLTAEVHEVRLEIEQLDKP